MTEEQRKTREDSIESSKGPGKFEAEPIYIPYYYDQILDGGTGEDIYFGEGQPVYTMIIVSDEDREIFPELADVFGICIWESEQGFVNSSEFETVEDYTDELDNLQKQAEEENEAELA
jgi:hypothetical protein